MGALFKTSWGDLNRKHGYERLNMTKYKKRNCGGWVNTCFTTKFLASVVLKSCPASESLEILVKKKKKKDSPPPRVFGSVDLGAQELAYLPSSHELLMLLIWVPQAENLCSREGRM